MFELQMNSTNFRYTLHQKHYINMEKKNINRRKFLNAAGLTAAGSVTVGSTLAAGASEKNVPLKRNDKKSVQ